MELEQHYTNGRQLTASKGRTPVLLALPPRAGANFHKRGDFWGGPEPPYTLLALRW